MTDIKFKMLPSSLSIPDDLNSFKSKKQAVWTGSSWRKKGTFSPDYGDTSSWKGESSVGIRRQETMYSDQQSSGLKWSYTTGYERENNLELYGDGRWMPANMFSGLGFEVYQSSSGTHGQYLKKYALVFAHKTNSSYRIWGVDTGARAPYRGYRYIYLVGNTTIPQTIRTWGPDWLFQGIILHVVNNPGGGTTESSLEAYNLKVGHLARTTSSTIKMIPATMRPYSNRDASSGIVGFTDPFTPK